MWELRHCIHINKNGINKQKEDTMKNKKTVFLIVLAIATVLATTGCSDSLSKAYYKKHPMSLDQVENRWGTPVDVKTLEGGIEKRVYRIQNPYTDLKFRYFLIKDNMILASGITDTGWTSPTRKAEVDEGFVPSDLSRAYYKTHETTISDIDNTWGKPIYTEDTADGGQIRVYEVDNPYTDFKFRKFIVKDNRVTASRISTSADASETDVSESKGLEINEISAVYYKNHPMSLGQAEKRWGTPVSIQNLSDGFEKRIYKIKNPYPAGFEFRFFIIKNKAVVSSGISDTLDMSK